MQPPERRAVHPLVVAMGVVLLVGAVVMALCFAVAGVLGGMAWLSQPAEATVTHSFAVSSMPSIVLDSNASNVHVVTGDASTVAVSFHKEVRGITHQAAQQALDAITLDASQSGNTVTLTTHVAPFDEALWFGYKRFDLTVTVPPAANLNVTLNAGNLDVTGVSGTLFARMNAGNLDLTGMTVSGDSSIHANAGNVHFRGALAPAAALDIVNTAGNVTVTLPRASATHLEASTTAGNVVVNGWQARSVNSGVNQALSADLNPQPNSTLSIHVTAGNIVVQPGA
jgi:DUF4097 and DUF4098 domain-containing protein YvlB